MYARMNAVLDETKTMKSAEPFLLRNLLKDLQSIGTDVWCVDLRLVIHSAFMNANLIEHGNNGDGSSRVSGTRSGPYKKWTWLTAAVRTIHHYKI
jgi:hypothetical protein